MSDLFGDTSAESRVGDMIGPYRLGALVGSGGMSSVYATRTVDGRAAALKLIKKSLARDDVIRSRVMREIRIARSVVNRHVVSVLDAGEDGDQLYLVTPFIEGGSLADALRREGSLSLRAVLTLCRDLAEGLQALWSAGMVHRDIKPANILLDLDGCAYIADFGLAKDLHGTRLTMPGRTLGSVDYIAPEQVRGKDVTPATDIYSLGCVVFECLEGHAPFSDRSSMSALWAHLEDEPPDLTREDLPAAVGAAVRTALRKDPATRPQTADAYTRSLIEASGIKLPR